VTKIGFTDIRMRAAASHCQTGVWAVISVTWLIILGGGGTDYWIFWRRQIRGKNWSQSVLSKRTHLFPILTPTFFIYPSLNHNKKTIIREKKYWRGNCSLSPTSYAYVGSITKFQYHTSIKTTDDLHCRGKSTPEQLIFSQPTLIFHGFIWLKLIFLSMKKLFDRISQPGPGLGIRISGKKPFKIRWYSYCAINKDNVWFEVKLNNAGCRI